MASIARLHGRSAGHPFTTHIHASRVEIPIVRAPPQVPHLPRVPSLEAFGQRPQCQSLASRRGRHPKSFTRAAVTMPAGARMVCPQLRMRTRRRDAANREECLSGSRWPDHGLVGTTNGEIMTTRILALVVAVACFFGGTAASATNLKPFDPVALRDTVVKTARNYGSFVALALGLILIKSVHTD